MELAVGKKKGDCMDSNDKAVSVKLLTDYIIFPLFDT